MRYCDQEEISQYLFELSNFLVFVCGFKSDTELMFMGIIERELVEQLWAIRVGLA